MSENVLARAADQRAVHTDSEVTIHDKGHRPSWRRSGTSRDHGEITFKVEHVDGVPILRVRLVEVHQPRGERPEARESVFPIYGSAALEVLEIVRELENAAPLSGPKGWV